MTLPIWCEIVCGDCATTIAGRYTYGNIPRREMKAEAIGKRWQVIEGDFYCRVCAHDRTLQSDTDRVGT